MSKVLNNLFLLSLSATAAFAGAGEIRPVAATRHDGTIRLPGRNGEVLLSTRDLDIDMILPNGTEWKGRLVVLFDPPSGWYIWRLMRIPGYTPADFASSSKIFVTPERIVAFWPYFRSITIMESKEKASNLNDAEDKAIHREASYLVEMHNPRGTASLNLMDLGWDFQQDPQSSAPPKEAKILSLTVHDRKWELTLEARWKVKVVLNDKFQILEQTRID